MCNAGSCCLSGWIFLIIVHFIDISSLFLFEFSKSFLGFILLFHNIISIFDHNHGQNWFITNFITRFVEISFDFHGFLIKNSQEQLTETYVYRELSLYCFEFRPLFQNEFQPLNLHKLQKNIFYTMINQNSQNSFKFFTFFFTRNTSVQ